MSDGARVVAGVLCLLVLVCVPVAAQSTPQTGIGEVSITGDGVITTETANGSTYIWQDESVNVSVTVADYSNARNYGVCLGYEREGAPAKPLAKCEPLSLPNETNGTVEFTSIAWPTNISGEQELVVEVRKRSTQNNVTLLDRKTVPITVLGKEDDFDNDGLTNMAEVEEGFNVSNPDMDADGLPDGAEENQYGSNPQRADSDGDGIRDGIEIQQGTNASATDTDGDGLSDRFETTGLLRTDPTDSATVLWLAVATLVIIGVLAGVFLVLRRGWRRRFGGSVVTPNGNGTTEATTTSEEEPREPSEPATEPIPEPLTDEDRVLGLLREHGGRMKQSHIVEGTDWSKAKVSRLLSAMNDEGTIEKLSIGRENIISLDGQGPEAAESPHEENATD